MLAARCNAKNTYEAKMLAQRAIKPSPTYAARHCTALNQSQGVGSDPPGCFLPASNMLRSAEQGTAHYRTIVWSPSGKGRSACLCPMNSGTALHRRAPKIYRPWRAIWGAGQPRTRWTSNASHPREVPCLETADAQFYGDVRKSDEQLAHAAA